MTTTYKHATIEFRKGMIRDLWAIQEVKPPDNITGTQQDLAYAYNHLGLKLMWALKVGDPDYGGRIHANLYRWLNPEPPNKYTVPLEQAHIRDLLSYLRGIVIEWFDGGDEIEEYDATT